MFDYKLSQKKPTSKQLVKNEQTYTKNDYPWCDIQLNKNRRRKLRCILIKHRYICIEVKNTLKNNLTTGKIKNDGGVNGETPKTHQISKIPSVS